MVDDRRVVLNSPAAMHDLTELGKCGFRRSGSGFRCLRLQTTYQVLIFLERLQQIVERDSRVPCSEYGLFGEIRHPLAIGSRGCSHSIGGDPLGKTPIPRRQHQAGAQSLHVPLPGTGESLVEIIDIENQSAFWRGIAAKVHEVAVAACLYGDPGHSRMREVMRLDDRRAPEEFEWRLGHP